MDDFPSEEKVIGVKDNPDWSLLERFHVEQVQDNVEINLKYSGYIEREKILAAKMHRLEHIAIPEDYDFDRITGLSIECRQKLKRYRPATIGQASRISGVSPSDISVLLIFFNR